MRAELQGRTAWEKPFPSAQEAALAQATAHSTRSVNHSDAALEATAPWGGGPRGETERTVTPGKAAAGPHPPAPAT